MKNKILILEYDKHWPEIYNLEKEKILAAIGDKVQAIEHIGSTAVVGLAAKPVIDIIVAIKDFFLTRKLIEPLQLIGYTYVPEYEINLPDRRFFHRGPSETTGAINKHFHLHIVEEGGNFWVTHILFRDYLRSHTEVAEKYAVLKKSLAVTSDGDINAYCSAKNDFIKNVIRLALESEKR